MRRIHSIISIVLVLLWVPLISHCEVEALLGIQPDHPSSCAEHSRHSDDSHSCPEVPSSGCDQCVVCQAVENGVVTSPSPNLDLKPVLVPVINLASGVGLEVLLRAPEPTASPPRPDELLPASWRFEVRVALPPRAPSIEA